MAAGVKEVPCPNCGEPADASAANNWRPFCSKRCKLIDLGDWLTEEHRIPERGGGESGEPWQRPEGDDTH